MPCMLRVYLLLTWQYSGHRKITAEQKKQKLWRAKYLKLWQLRFTLNYKIDLNLIVVVRWNSQLLWLGALYKGCVISQLLSFCAILLIVHVLLQFNYFSVLCMAEAQGSKNVAVIEK